MLARWFVLALTDQTQSFRQKESFYPMEKISNRRPKPIIRILFYYPLYEDIEKYVQELDKRKLASRLAYIVSKQRKAILIKTIEVLDQGFNKNTLDKIKTDSAKNYGRH